MKGLLLVFVVLFLLSYVPPVRSGPNLYINRMFGSCWRMKGTCKIFCAKNEVYHIYCNSVFACCVSKRDLPSLVG
ncbi:beta-defensin 135 [Cavia porcellus]|uniref:beta-defensin 135 n=1 Tax=Cavia porcellus TaxID=10141 RepID=UPI00022B70B6|nr:beta-defensin 135 [Cavia porcellus]